MNYKITDLSKQITENKRKSIHMLIDLKYDIKFIVNGEQYIMDLSQYFRHKKLKFFSLHNCKEIHLLSCKSFIFNLLWCFVTQSTVTSFASNSSLVYWLPKSLWRIIPSVSLIFRHAFLTAWVASSAVMFLPYDQPIIFRSNKSITDAR